MPWSQKEKNEAVRFWRSAWKSPAHVSDEDIQRYWDVCESFTVPDWLTAQMDFWKKDPRPLDSQAFRPTPSQIAATVSATPAATSAEPGSTTEETFNPHELMRRDKPRDLSVAEWLSSIAKRHEAATT